MTIPCHCLIKHPEKPKFLVIRHSDQWSPPMLQVPEKGHLMFKPAIINDGMMQKYSLRTTVLRFIVAAKNYALVELELHASSQREMQAVWVGREEYRQFRNLDDNVDDPIEHWLEEQAKGDVPPWRAPWELPGWFKEAETWITEKLMKSGIQVSGSVQQFKAGWPSACLLRVRTVQGDFYFKAAHAKPPGEARLIATLARHWPDIVPEPFAVDAERNWILMRDYGVRTDNQPGHSEYPEFARTLGFLQVSSRPLMDTWRDMNCPVLDLAFMRNQDGQSGVLIERVRHGLKQGANPLSDEELDQLHRAVEQARARCARLEAFGIADTLSHLDFRPDNFFLKDGKHWIIDWADVAVTHPFIALCQTLHFFNVYSDEEAEQRQENKPSDEVKMQMTQAYLSAFADSLPAERANEAFELAGSVFEYFWFLYTAFRLQSIEPRSALADTLYHRARTTARALIAQVEP